MIKTASRDAVALAICSLYVVPCFAQTATTATTTTSTTHKNLVQRHPYATGMAAGIATHHALKVAAAHDKASGRKLNWAERHPTLSAIGVGSVTTHEIKKHTATTTTTH